MALLTIKYNEDPEVYEDEGTMTTTVVNTSVKIEDATTDKLKRIVDQFLDDLQEVEVSIKHKPAKE